MNDQQEAILKKINEKLLHKRCYSVRDSILGNTAEDGKNSYVPITESHLFTTFYEKRKKYTLDNDPTGALTELADLVVEAPAPNAIGRSLANIVETTKTSVQYRLPKLAKAAKTAGSRKTPASRGERNTFKTVNVDQFLESSERWSRSFLEEAEYDVEAREIEKISESLKLKFSQEIINKLESMASADLAGGQEMSPASAGSLTYNDIVDMRQQVHKEDFNPQILVVGSDGLGQLLKDDTFINAWKLGERINKETGGVINPVLGFEILSTNQVTETGSSKIAMMIDTDVVLALPILRDETLDTWDIPPDETAARVSMRYGLDTLRPQGLARMDWA